MDDKWEYDDNFGLFQSIEPIFVVSMQGRYDIWYDVTEQHPSTKQIAAWNEFYNLSPGELRKQFIAGFANFDKKISALSKNSELTCSSFYNPKIIKKAVQKTIFALQKSDLPLGNMDSSVFRCDSLVIPLQEKCQCHFVLMNFELGVGLPDKPDGFEMEGLFCNRKLLLTQENTGLWTRLEWEEKFNTSLFEPATVHYTYWK